MFNNKTNSTSKESSTGLATIIASGTEIKGNIESKGDLRVDGLLTGNVSTTGKVIIGAGGQINGDVNATNAEVLGHISGTVTITELLSLKGTCEVNGNIYTGQLQVDATASFNGECHMGVTVNTKVVAVKKEVPNTEFSEQKQTVLAK